MMHDRFFLHWINQIEALMYIIAVVCGALSVVLVIAALLKLVSASQQNSMMGQTMGEHLSIVAHEVIGAVLLFSLSAVAVFGAGALGVDVGSSSDQFSYGVPTSVSPAQTFIVALCRLFSMSFAAGFALSLRRAADKNGSGYKGPFLMLLIAGALLAPFEVAEFFANIFSPYPVNFGYTPGF